LQLDGILQDLAILALAFLGSILGTFVKQKVVNFANKRDLIAINRDIETIKATLATLSQRALKHDKRVIKFFGNRDRLDAL